MQGWHPRLGEPWVEEVDAWRGRKADQQRRCFVRAHTRTQDGLNQAVFQAEEASQLDPPPAAGAGVAYASTSPSSCARTLPTLAGVSESNAAGGCVGARGGSSSAASAASAASAHSTYGMWSQAVSIYHLYLYLYLCMSCHVMCNMHMTCHMPHATCHMPHATCHMHMHMHMHMRMRTRSCTLRSSAPARCGPGRGRSRAHWSACMAKCSGVVDLDGA